LTASNDLTTILFVGDLTGLGAASSGIRAFTPSSEKASNMMLPVIMDSTSTDGTEVATFQKSNVPVKYIVVLSIAVFSFAAIYFFLISM
jgi:hypothetical protein